MFVIFAPCSEVCPLFLLPQRQHIKDPKGCAVSLSSQSSIMFGQMSNRGDTVDRYPHMRCHSNHGDALGLN
jgi:hypothetical protein